MEPTSYELNERHTGRESGTVTRKPDYSQQCILVHFTDLRFIMFYVHLVIAMLICRG